MNKINTIIFDLGGVLIDWSPDYVFLDEFDGDHDKMESFYENICTTDWNENQDAGYPIKKATEERVKMFPEHEELIRMFYGRWEEMLGDQIDGTVEILKALVKSKKFKVVALTNWSNETFPIALEKFEFLKWFEGIVVSGKEKTRKPFEEIYKLTLERYNIEPEKAVFIDDNIRNVRAAQLHQINGIHFKSPEELKLQLMEYGIKV